MRTRSCHLHTLGKAKSSGSTDQRHTFSGDPLCCCKGLNSGAVRSLSMERTIRRSSKRAAEHVSPTLFSEVIPTVDDGLEAESKGFDGIILIGPFNCLPFRISEAILKPLSLQREMPLLADESDGYAVAPSFLRQVDVHIQQVLAHAAHNSEAARTVTARADSPDS